MTEEFYLSRKEFDGMQRFMDKHQHSKIFILKYTGTGIGVATEIECGKCLEQENITDYDDW